MANLANIVRRAVAIANGVTSSLQMTVKYQALTRHMNGDPDLTRDGTNKWNTAVTYTALVEQKQELKRKPDGTDQLSHYKMALLVSGLTIDSLDRFTFANGTPFPPILATQATFDENGVAYMWEIWF